MGRYIDNANTLSASGMLHTSQLISLFGLVIVYWILRF